MISEDIKQATKLGWRESMLAIDDKGNEYGIEYLRMMPDDQELRVACTVEGTWTYEVTRKRRIGNETIIETVSPGIYLAKEDKEEAKQAAYNVWADGKFDDFDGYQNMASITRTDTKHMPINVYLCLGLSGETGEAIEKIKKIYRDKDGKINDYDRAALTKEFGDILWYLGQLAMVSGISLSNVAADNIEKILDRLQRDKVHGEGDNR